MDSLFTGRCKLVHRAINRASVETLIEWQENPTIAAKVVDGMAFNLGLCMRAASVIAMALVILTLNWVAICVTAAVILLVQLYVDSVWRCPYEASVQYRRWAEDTFPTVEFNRCLSVLEVDLWATLSQKDLIAKVQANQLQKKTAEVTTDKTSTRRL